MVPQSVHCKRVSQGDSHHCKYTWMLAPLGESATLYKTARRSSLAVHLECCYPKTAHNLDFALQAHPCSPGATNETTIVVAYNSGMGSGDQKLQASWSTDVAFLLDQDILCLFTCANDYMDVPGEVRVMQQHQARFMIAPCPCPFAAMTVLVPEGSQSHCTTQANSFAYAVKGRQ
jgi:hypothetical protein